MFKCELTGKTSKPGEKLQRVVIATRPKVYHAMVLNEDTRRYERVEVGTGFETVKELKMTEEGLELWQTLSAEQRKRYL